MVANSLWSIICTSRRTLECEEAMVGSSGVDRRKGTDVDDCGYGRRSSLYSNVGGGGTGVWRQSSRLSNRVSLM